MKTDDELLEVSLLMVNDPYGAGLKAYATLTEEEKQRMMQLVHAKSNAAVQKVIADAEADGTMNRIRELYAQDQAKKKT